MSGQISLADVRLAALNLLAMREHSAGELVDKLGRKFSDPELIAQVITALKAQNLQSDERFAEAFICMRQRQGKGSVLIKIELRERGIDSSLIAALINESDVAWFRSAQEVRRKRFPELPTDAREKARQMRFLHSRGFACHHIQAAVSGAPDDN